MAAEAQGFGICPLSLIRNRAGVVSKVLGLPDHVFAYAGLVLRWPDGEGAITPRLPLRATIHLSRFEGHNIRPTVES